MYHLGDYLVEHYRTQFYQFKLLSMEVMICLGGGGGGYIITLYVKNVIYKS